MELNKRMDGMLCYRPGMLDALRFLVVSSFALFLAVNLSCKGKSGSDEAKIFYINSYHEGYGSSDDIMKGIDMALQGNEVVLKRFFMDTKRNNSRQHITRMVDSALSEIKSFVPDVIIVSDDNAVKYLIEPYFNNSGVPVVFCGVNWSEKQYGLGDNITGMLEVLPLRETLTIGAFGDPISKRLTVLSENSLSERNNKIILDTLFTGMGLEVDYALVDDFSSWKEMFVHANDNSDLIYLPTNGAIKNWDDGIAKTHVQEHIKVPVVTCDDFMMPYCVFGLTKVAQEQGEWAATTALAIINGKKTTMEIPIARNHRTEAFLNTVLAERIAFGINDSLMAQCTKL